MQSAIVLSMSDKNSCEKVTRLIAKDYKEHIETSTHYCTLEDYKTF